MMPATAEERRAPRIVGVEFPFGHPFGMPNNRDMQRGVLGLALRALAGDSAFGARLGLDGEWPVPGRAGYLSLSPNEHAPPVQQQLFARRQQGARTDAVASAPQ